MVASFNNKKQSYPGNLYVRDPFINHSAVANPSVHVPTTTPGVSNCYVFKSRLQEYAQKVGLSTPVYETIKEGPSHEPSFRSTVVVDGVRYDSLPGFFNRKAAEQSAAEIALMELSKCGDEKDRESISVPVHETGLCKNLLQEYAQKMNYAIPSYLCRKDDSHGRASLFSCTVEIGGIRYIGATAKTKKDAEIKAARTALLAIRSGSGVAGENSCKPQYSVVPGKRKVPETPPPQPEAVKRKKQKKPRFRKQRFKKRNPNPLVEQIQDENVGVSINSNTNTEGAVKEAQNSVFDVKVPDNVQTLNCLASEAQTSETSKTTQINGDLSSAGEGSLIPVPNVSLNNCTSQLASGS